jgi:hypothetical protein
MFVVSWEVRLSVRINIGTGQHRFALSLVLSVRQQVLQGGPTLPVNDLASTVTDIDSGLRPAFALHGHDLVVVPLTTLSAHRHRHHRAIAFQQPTIPTFSPSSYSELVFPAFNPPHMLCFTSVVT